MLTLWSSIWNFYPKLYNSKFLIPILPKGGVLRDPHLKGMDSIPRKDGMDLIKPIKDKIDTILSQYHFIEPNDRTETEET